MDISPAILRLKPEPDASQQQVIGHTEGPMLVIAGPGSGKTGSIQLRAVNLLLTGRAKPGELVLCTFGRDAARQLQRRFTSSALACGVPGDLSPVNITTIHSLCHRLLRPHAALVGLRPGYRVMDDEEQRLLLREEPDEVFGPEWDTLSRRGWHGGVQTVDETAGFFDRICDELIDPEDLVQSERPFIAALGRCCLRYRNLLLQRNAVDFAHLQVWAHRVMQDDGVAATARAAIRHLMVDEFQDTSRVQMRILERLAGISGNIVAVGDDDQSIYRFRGASVANLLEFSRRFPGCRVERLTTNYRSHRDIIAAVGQWMNSAALWEPDGRSFRYVKDIVPDEPDSHSNYPALISVLGQDPAGEVRQLAELLRFLKDQGVIAGYGQVALLLHSVKDSVSGPYIDGLERAGVRVRCEPAGHIHTHADNEVLVTTIHQAKGREWDVVIVGSLNGPDLETDRVGGALADYIEECTGEPAEYAGEFDRARRHYVAFTRARRLLVLTATGEPHARFDDIWEVAGRWPDIDRETLARQRFGARRNATLPDVIEIGHLDRLVLRLGQGRGVA